MSLSSRGAYNPKSLAMMYGIDRKAHMVILQAYLLNLHTSHAFQ
nr:hypothetical protein [Alicyclobacillus tolerans]